MRRRGSDVVCRFVSNSSGLPAVTARLCEQSPLGDRVAMRVLLRQVRFLVDRSGLPRLVLRVAICEHDVRQRRPVLDQLGAVGVSAKMSRTQMDLPTVGGIACNAD